MVSFLQNIEIVVFSMMDVYPSKFDRMKKITHQGMGNLKAHLLALGLGVIAYQKH